MEFYNQENYEKYFEDGKIYYDYMFYIASPFFNEEQIDRVERIKKVLDEKGLAYYSPKDDFQVQENATKEEREKCFLNNLMAIQSSCFVLVVTDGKDMGTIFEAGYSYAFKKPIVYFAETLGDNPFNLMLAESGIAVLRSTDELKDIEVVDLNGYTGKIE